MGHRRLVGGGGHYGSDHCTIVSSPKRSAQILAGQRATIADLGECSQRVLHGRHQLLVVEVLPALWILVGQFGQLLGEPVCE